MPAIQAIDPHRMSFVIDRNFGVRTQERKAGPPERADGMTVGVVEMHTAPPHGGEMHPDGDEMIYIISGLVRIHGDSTPEHPLDLGPGGACIIPKGEWHNIEILEPVKLVHITPGPGGEHRPRRKF